MAIVKKGYGVELFSSQFTCKSCECIFTQSEEKFILCIQINKNSCNTMIGAFCLDCDRILVKCNKYPEVVEFRLRQKINNISIQSVEHCECDTQLRDVSIIKKKTWFGLSSETFLILEHDSDDCNEKHVVNIDDVNFPKDILKMIENSTINRP